MTEKQGIISSYGSEISSDSVASLRKFVIGHDYGILDIENCRFEPEIKGTNRVQFNGGYVYAYGYIAYIPNPTVFNLYLGAVPQYYFAYVEIDKSVVPNVCEIKLKNNQNSPYMNEWTFRQDELSRVKTGIHQTPICLLKTVGGENGGVTIVENYIAGTERVYNPNPPFSNTTLHSSGKTNYSFTTSRVLKNINGNVLLNKKNFTVGKNLSSTEYVDNRAVEEINRSVNI